MGSKHVCFICRKAFNASYGATGPSTCPDCGHAVVVLSHRFRPPKKREVAKWKVVKYLVEHGFFYHHISSPDKPSYVKYPENMRDAEEFVKTYQTLA